MNPNIKLQPLRVPTGWRIHWNRFYEIDPPEPIPDEYRDCFDQEIFFATFYSMERGRQIGLDLGRGSGGNYLLHVVHHIEIKINESHKRVIKIRKEGRTLRYYLEPNLEGDPANWETAILTTRSRIDIAGKMDEIMYDVAENRGSGYWKREVKL